MQGELSHDRRPHFAASIGIMSLALWLLFGRTQPPPPTISAWHDDMLPDRPVAEAKTEDSFTAIFEQLQQPEQAQLGKAGARQVEPGKTLAQPSDRQAAEQAQAAPADTAKEEERKEVNAELATTSQPQDMPWGNPTGTPRAVMTQGYDVGTHAPATIWGGIDIAIDEDGDGQANPSTTWNHPLYATMSGVVEVRPNSVPAGHHVWIKNKRYKVGYGHLQRFAVKHGQKVQRGDLIGYIGATGFATGPHLHYHIWEDGVNVNPLKFEALP